MEKFAFLAMVLTCEFTFFCIILQRLILALWPNETGKGSLSKGCQRSETTCNSIFRRFGLLFVEKFAFLTIVLTREFTLIQKLI